MAGSRRERGTGSVSQRKDGTWTARLTIGLNENGSPKVKAFYGKTESEVKRKLKSFQTELIKNDYVMTQKGTVASFITTWMKTVKVNELKPKSYDRLEQTIQYQIIPYIGHLQLAALTADDIQKLLNTLRENKLSYSTVKKAYNALTDCFSNAIAKHSVQRNPMIGVSLPRKDLFDSQDIKYYTREETKLICTTAQSKYNNENPKYHLGDSIVILLNTGLRTAEFAGLRWSNVDFNQRQIYIEATRVVVKDRSGDKHYKTITQNSTKSKAGRRTISLNDAALNAFRHLYTITGNAEYVFSNKNGQPMTIRYLDKMLRKIVAAAGLPKDKQYGPHALRHTFASFLFESGVDVKTVSEILGHADVNITYNTYIHLIEAQQRKTAAVYVISDIF